MLPVVEHKDTVSLAEYLYSIEYLKSENMIKSYVMFQKYIKEGFKRYISGRENLSIENNKTRDIIISKYAVQAIGRICRVPTDSSDKYIYIHQNIKSSLLEKKTELLKHMLNYKFRKLLEYIGDLEEPIEIGDYIEENYDNNQLASDRIWLLSRKWWNDEKKFEWIDLREHVLKYPTGNNDNSYEKFYCKFEESISDYAYQFVRLSKCKLKIFNVSNTDIYMNYINRVSIKASRVDKILNSVYVRNYFEEHGYATDFTKSNTILNPITFRNIYKGAIGEVAGKAILEGKNIVIKEITSNEMFEKFDFYNGEIFYDMKNWSENFSRKKKELLGKILDKASACNAKVVFIINVLKTKYDSIHETKIAEITIYEIPWLYDSENDSYNEEAIKLIKEAEVIYGDSY